MARRNLSALDTAALQQELHRRRRAVPKLMKKREALLAKLGELDAAIAALGGTPARGSGGLGRTANGGVRKRPRNESNLVEALQKLLDGKQMNVTTAAEEVQRAGYKTTSATFRTIVNQTLINSGRFKRVSRGVYTAK